MNAFRTTAMLAAILGVAACGGGDSGGDGVVTSKADSYTYTGTVPGTLIEAFCDNGGYYATASQGGGSDRHRFELTLPAHMVCHLVMTTAEDDPGRRVVTPLGFADANGRTSTAASAPGGSVIDLGHVALFTSRDHAGGFDADHDGILDAPMSLGRPAGLKIAQHHASALDPDGDGIIESYDDEDDNGIPNRDDANYSRRNHDLDRDGLHDAVDVDPRNERGASNHYPSAMDHDADGYLDEDHNHDGYHDDDMNHDGFHDGSSGSMMYVEVSGTIDPSTATSSCCA